jgi:hypothetical protein
MFIQWKIVSPGTSSPEGEYRIVDPDRPLIVALCYNPNPPNNANPVVVGRPVDQSPQHNIWNITANAPNSSEKAFQSVCLGHHTFVKSSQFSSLVTVDLSNRGQAVVLGNNVPNSTTPFVVCVSSLLRNISILSDANTRGLHEWRHSGQMEAHQFRLVFLPII